MTKVKSIPKIEDKAAFLEALEPHVNRLCASAMFMNMDCKWSGAEAAELADLLDAMADWIEGPAHKAMKAAFTVLMQHEGDNGNPEASVYPEVQTSNYGGFFEKTVANLRAASLPGLSVTVSGNSVALLKAMVDDLTRRTFIIIPDVMRQLAGGLEIIVAASDQEGRPGGP